MSFPAVKDVLCSCSISVIVAVYPLLYVDMDVQNYTYRSPTHHDWMYSDILVMYIVCNTSHHMQLMILWNAVRSLIVLFAVHAYSHQNHICDTFSASQRTHSNLNHFRKKVLRIRINFVLHDSSKCLVLCNDLYVFFFFSVGDLDAMLCCSAPCPVLPAVRITVSTSFSHLRSTSHAYVCIRMCMPCGCIHCAAAIKSLELADDACHQICQHT